MEDKQFNLLMDEIRNIKEDISELKEDVLTKDDVMKVNQAFHEVAVTATTAETKAEAGYAVLSSLFKGLEDRMSDGFSKVNKQLDAMADTLHGINELLTLMVEKDQQQDAMIESFNNRMVQIEKTNFLIQKKLKQLGGE